MEALAEQGLRHARGIEARCWRCSLPTIVYVVADRVIGIYVASAIYIGAFMIWQGKYKWLPTLAVSIGVPVAIFLLFEIWFLVPLPKGPVEQPARFLSGLRVTRATRHIEPTESPWWKKSAT